MIFKEYIFAKNPPNFPDVIDKKRLMTTKPFVGSRSPVGSIRFAAITGCSFGKESYPLLARSQHFGTTAVVTLLPLICCLNNITCFLLITME